MKLNLKNNSWKWKRRDIGLTFWMKYYWRQRSLIAGFRTKVVPILKPKKDPQLSESYGPISLLSCARKILVIMLHNRLDYWAEKIDILSSSQYGFRKCRGTRDCLALLTTDIQTSFENNRQWLPSLIYLRHMIMY
jgi:hypothetical protein